MSVAAGTTADGFVTGQGMVRALLNIMISDLVAFFSVGKTMGAHQVIQTAGFIWDDYKHLKPEDIKLCFDRIKKGYYGKSYDRIDGNIILTALAAYDDERSEQIELIRTAQSIQVEKQLKATTNEGNSDQRNALQQMIADMSKRMKNREVIKQKEKDPVLDPIALMHQDWLKQFDRLYRRAGKMMPGKRFIKRYGRMLDITEFMEYKQGQYLLAMRRTSR